MSIKRSNGLKNDQLSIVGYMSVAAVVVLLFTGTANAIRPQQWVHRTESDFEQAELDNAVVTNLGEVQLTRIAKDIAELEGEDSIIYDIVKKPNGMMWIACGPEGKLLQLDPINGELTTVAEYEKEQIFALCDAEAGVWIGVSGAESRLELRDNEGKVLHKVRLEGVRYVWSILPDRNEGYVWVATGTEGKVFFVSTDVEVDDIEVEIEIEGEVEAKREVEDEIAGEEDEEVNVEGENGEVVEVVIMEEVEVAEESEVVEDGDEEVLEEGKVVLALNSTQPNVLCLGMDGEGKVYAGTDGDGLIYRIIRNEELSLVVGNGDEDGDDEASDVVETTSNEEGKETDDASNEMAEKDDNGEKKNDNDNGNDKGDVDGELSEGAGEVKVEKDSEVAHEAFDTFIVFDANEPEIGALLVLDDGRVYAGTAAATQAKPGRMKEAITELKGRLEKDKAMKMVEEGKPEEMEEGSQEGKKVEVEEESVEANGESDGENGVNVEENGKVEDEAVDEDASEIEADVDESVVSDDTTEEAAEDELPLPTEEQYDELREVIRERLAQAVESGEMEAEPRDKAKKRSTVSSHVKKGNGKKKSQPKVGGPSSVASSKQGNAIYEITRDGFAREVFRESVMILRIVEQGDKLIVATGNEGQLYRVDPEDGETTVLVELNVKQIPSLVVSEEGQIIVGTANPGLVLSVGDEYASDGSCTSSVLDASQISLWGKLRVIADVPDGSTVEVQTRSGNVADSDAGGWSEWSEEGVLVEPEFMGMPMYFSVASPPARFMQYRLGLTSNGQVTPRIGLVTMKYLVPNIGPKVSSLKAGYAITKGKKITALTKMKIEWEATDANKDRMKYKLEVCELGGEGVFIELADDLDDKNYEWDTRTMPDGRYVIRVEADDSPDNVPGSVKSARRLSSAVVIDNTPPVIDEVVVKGGEKAGEVEVTCRAIDKLCDIIDLRYSVNGGEDWEPILPDDMIYDSTIEKVSFTIYDLSSGPAVVTLRATDALGNTNHVSRTVIVPR